MQIEVGKTYITQGGWEAMVTSVDPNGRFSVAHKERPGMPVTIGEHELDGSLVGFNSSLYSLIREKTTPPPSSLRPASPTPSPISNMQIKVGKTYITRGGWEAEVRSRNFTTYDVDHGHRSAFGYIVHSADGTAHGLPDYDLIQEKIPPASNPQAASSTYSLTFIIPTSSIDWTVINSCGFVCSHDFPNNEMLRSWCKHCGHEGSFNRDTGMFDAK